MRLEHREPLRVCVSDTSVLVDLDRGSFVEAVFSLPVEFVVPDLLYERELRQHGGEELRELGLRVEELDGPGVVGALGYRVRESSLSLVDSFALALAVENHWILLTGDRVLRRLARSEGVDCHGLLWVLDLMAEATVVDRRTLYLGLEAIGDHPRCRLPRAEVNKRLERWRPG